MGKICVVGSLNMDLVARGQRIPVVGETVLGESFNQVPGGKGANQAAAMGRLQGHVAMVGKVGQDAFGQALIQALKDAKVDTQGVTKAPTSTGIALITVQADGDNAIVVVPGANAELKPADIDAAKSVIEESEIVITQLESPLDTVTYALKLAKEQGKVTILNPAPAVPLADELIQNVDYLTPNETELAILSGMPTESQDELQAAAKAMMAKGVKVLIVTLGSKGCLVIDENGSRQFPAFKVKAVDTTAAGDSFNGGVAVALAEGKSLEEAIEFATKVGALTVQKAGAQSSLPTRQEVDGFRG
ncbi:ribokinase [Gottschalkiaceae bacterium SANA]|nr:ribokinase [Gottschalkiaceae bacterium SANA]